MAKTTTLPPDLPRFSPPDTGVQVPRPDIHVLERARSDPFGIPSSPVELVNPGFVTRWVNTELKGGAQLHYFTDLGYLKARTEYLKNPDRVQYKASVDGYVVRGHREEEILMYTTIEHYREIRRRKDSENHRRLTPHVIKRDLSEAAAKSVGQEAAEYLERRVGPIGDVRVERERIERTGEEA